MTKKGYLSLFIGFSSFEKLLLLALLITGIALISQHFWIKQSLVIKPGGPYSANLISDAAIGGKSSTEWIDSDYFNWQCKITRHYEYPYCLLQFLLTDMNLSRYSQMRLGLKYYGPGETVRITLRNKHPAYSINDQPETFKYNEVEVSKQMLNSTLVLQMDSFRVADWWLRERKIVPEDSHPDFSNIVYLEIVTGTDIPDGIHRFELSSISLSGELITKESMYLSIIIGWILLILGQLIIRVWNLKSAVEQHYQREQALIKLNRTLNQKTRKFQKMASTDSLTGIGNRAGISDILIQEIKKYYAKNQALSLIIVDIDHFKVINDRYGHDRGDEVLKEIANNLKDNIRATDGIGRWGGEEFMLVCPNTTLNNAYQLAEKLRQQFKTLNLSDGIEITGSFGVAGFSDESIESFIKRADEALYKAKESGRNCVIQAE
jgi:diguanylate cyclase (GGDEF)-like protein